MKFYAKGHHTEIEKADREFWNLFKIFVLTLVSLLIGIGIPIYNLLAAERIVDVTSDDLGQGNGAFELGVDLDALAYAVGRHETGNCSTGGNFVAVNNCHGIKVWDGEKTVPAPFPGYINGIRFETSHEAFKDLWVRKYGGFPTKEQAIKYSGNDRAEIWHSNVSQFYAEATKINLTF